MKLSIKKALSFALACALTLGSVGAVDMANAAKKSAGKIQTGKITIQAAADKAVPESTTVTGVAISSKGALRCNFDSSYVNSIASASAVAASGDAVKVTVTATKNAVAVTDAAVAVLSNNTTVASVLVTVKGLDQKKVVKKTKTLSIQKKVVIAPNKTKIVKFTAKKTAAADKIQAVKVSSSNENVVRAKKVSGKKQIELTVPASAKRGSSAKVTLKSGKKTAEMKVFVTNKAKKIKAAKKTVMVKKGKKASVKINVTAQNKNKATTDKITKKIAKKKIFKVTKTANKKKKVVFTVQGKTRGNSKMTVKIGSKSVKLTVKVR